MLRISWVHLSKNIIHILPDEIIAQSALPTYIGFVTRTAHIVLVMMPHQRALQHGKSSMAVDSEEGDMSVGNNADYSCSQFHSIKLKRRAMCVDALIPNMLGRAQRKELLT